MAADRVALDRAYGAAENRVVHHFAGLIEGHSATATRDIVGAFVEALVSELPEEAVEEVAKGIAFDADPDEVARAFLRALSEAGP
jgi:hypothetical protein